MRRLLRPGNVVDDWLDREATAADLEALGERVREKVAQTSGVELEWEIQRIGRPAGQVRS
mgnify:CR=1 FL=1